MHTKAHAKAHAKAHGRLISEAAKWHGKAHANAHVKAHAETTPFGNEVNCWLVVSCLLVGTLTHSVIYWIAATQI